MKTALIARLTYEYQYDTEEERLAHIDEMVARGFTVSGPAKRSTDPFYGKTPRVFRPYAKFEKNAPSLETEVPHV